jgi:hypothetical protein
MTYSVKNLDEDAWQRFGMVNCMLYQQSGKKMRLVEACRKVGLRMERYYLMKKELQKEEGGGGDDDDNN